MEAKIDEKILFIPPYISTTWDRILYLHTSEEASHETVFFIHLVDGCTIRITNLDPSLLRDAFSAHMRYLEKQNPPALGKKEESNGLGEFFQQMTQLLPKQLLNIPIKINIPKEFLGVENLEMAFQHTPEQAHLPDLPQEVLERICSTVKAVCHQDIHNFPKPEPHCNCMHCQLGRAIHQKGEAQEEVVSDEELTFRSWDIQECGEKMYTVTNPLDAKEQYNVYLGSPVGCTCGQSECEHIRAVLYSC